MSSIQKQVWEKPIWLETDISVKGSRKRKQETNSATNATFSIHYCLFLNTYLVLKKGILSHCKKVQKYKRAKYVSNFLICGANNVVQHYRKRIEILHGHPFVCWPNRSCPSHLFWQKLADWLKWPWSVRSAFKRTHMQDFNCFSIMFY